MSLVAVYLKISVLHSVYQMSSSWDDAQALLQHITPTQMVQIGGIVCHHVETVSGTYCGITVRVP